MAKPGPKPKDPERRQTSRQVGHSEGKKHELSLIPRTSLEPPKPDKNWYAATKRAWEAYFGSDVSNTYQPSDLPTIRRLFAMYDERERLLKAIGTEYLTPGSTKQPSLNPLYSRVKDIEAHIKDLEREFGLTPSSRNSLGITLGDATKSLEEMNARLADRVKGDEEDDPRL